MLPLQQAYETRHSIIEYLRSTFDFRDPALRDSFIGFLEDPKRGMFKGPYISLKMPFVQANEHDDIPLEIKPSLTPWLHQLTSFRRLTSQNGHQPRSTLITTGTSSGKTECFLYPILDACHRMQDRPGIKVIILYPMNALATDQAKRFAKAIWDDPRLKGRVRAGLFLGESKDGRKYPDEMGAEHIIENRDAIVDNPPDILLTNFKMLDYALMKGRFHRLLYYNIADPSLLKFLVLDELHTYDGAQGTDVANLIRRLKLKLGMHPGQLCAIGTSATIGAGADAAAQLRSYASRVFGEEFDEDSVIVERRKSAEDIFDPVVRLETFLPRINRLSDCRLQERETYATYIARQKRLWQLDDDDTPLELTRNLTRLLIVRDLVEVAASGVSLLSELIEQLVQRNTYFRRLNEMETDTGLDPCEEIVHSLLALISEARLPGTNPMPFLYLQVQYWIRELSGVRREMGLEPVFCWSEDVDPERAHALPAYFCRECGASGWLGYKADNQDGFLKDADEVNRKYFENNRNIYFINTPDHPPVDEYQPTDRIDAWLDVRSLHLLDRKMGDACPIIATRIHEKLKPRHICPECNGHNTISVIGTRVATLASITVSQVLASDLDPREEQYRKVLAFTNGVQDAAHHAAFIEARNYRFTLRASIQKFLNHHGTEIDLERLHLYFLEYWKTNSDPTGAADEEAFYHRFLPSDLKSRMDIDADYRVAGKLTDAFRQEFDLRLGWEIMAEFGFNAGIGRTLEKTGASSCRLDQKLLTGLYDLLHPWLEANNLGMIKEDGLKSYVNGLIHRFRMRGAVAHPFLDKYRTNGFRPWDLNWMKDDRHFLNRMFGPSTRLPRLVITSAQAKGRADSTFTTHHSWVRSFFIRHFPMATDHPPILNDFHAQLLSAMETSGILDRYEAEGVINHAIHPKALLVDRGTHRFVCDVCGDVLQVAVGDTLTDGMGCLDYACKGGRYVRQPEIRSDYYRMVYNRNRSPRIYAAEHTGLLERKDREAKESDFKQRSRHDSLNTIVATSTLEMGIDIGTLNIVLNDGIPPTTANFLQRIGRAGRSSGSALVVNLALNQAHDLFYFEDPMEMMEGEIRTPGCFLEARDILLRHFLAFCIDSWAMQDPDVNTIPATLFMMKLFRRSADESDHFHHRLIRFINDRRELLLARFTDFYANDIKDPEVPESLRIQVRSGSLTQRLSDVFHKVQDEYRYLQQKIREIDDIIKAKNLGTQDPERISLLSERRGFIQLRRLIDARNTAEHLTNAGLLPNYAFPETGVRLQSRIQGERAKGSDINPVHRPFELVRPARTAIRELAPGNRFFAFGYMHPVTGLDVSDWREDGVLTEFRFCSVCDHYAEGILPNGETCPKCSDPSWGSERNRHAFVRMSGVRSFDFRSSATIDDGSEERDRANFRISKHIQFQPASFGGAYALKDVPFGIEYQRNAVVMTANLGLASSEDADNLSINGQDAVPRHGFVTCRHCGYSTSAPHRENHHHHQHRKPFHYPYCRFVDKVYEQKTDEVFEQVYLYRSMQTEAVKVLLPVQQIDTEAAVAMFKAGIELGLRRYFRGSPQHIETADYREYNHGSLRFDRYVVLYDSIPGGTGYVAKLFDTAIFTDIIRFAYEGIRDCGCQQQGRDGCYRCIFTYSNRYVRDQLSRAKAERLFKDILQHTHDWEQLVDRGLNSVTGNGRIEESELELRFLRCLRAYAEDHASEGCAFLEELQPDGVMEYRLTLSGQQRTLTYRIRPQVNLGAAEGLERTTRADFVIRLAAVQEGATSVWDPSYDAVLPIAVYLDGYTFHARDANLRVRDDFEIRHSIVQTGQMLTWTLTWGDLDRFESIDPDKRKDALAWTGSYKAGKAALSRLPAWADLHKPFTEAHNSMDRLLSRLIHPDLPRMQMRRAVSLLMLQRQFGYPSVREDEIDAWLQPGAEVPSSKVDVVQDGRFYIFPDLQWRMSGFADTVVAIRLRDLEIRAAVHLYPLKNSVDRTHWEQCWQLFNMVQEESLLTLDMHHDMNEGTTEEGPEQFLQDLLDIYDASVHEVVRKLHAAGIELHPDGGIPVVHEGEMAEAHIILDKYKVFFIPFDEHDRKLLIALGYRECPVEGFDISMLDGA
jgi:DEAD/DEAH box helicase domain-containing protein